MPIGLKSLKVIHQNEVIIKYFNSIKSDKY